MNLEREPMEVGVVGGAKPKPTGSSAASGSKKRSPKSPRKSRPNQPEMQSSQDTALPPETKPREKRHHKEKRSSHRGGKQQPEQDPNAPSGSGGGAALSGNGNKSKTPGDKPPRTRVRQGSQRQSIRRQSQVEHPHDQQQHGPRDSVSVSGRKSKVPEEMSGAGGGVISGAELSDVFDEESQHQYYPEDSDIKYMEDRSNCRKK